MAAQKDKSSEIFACFKKFDADGSGSLNYAEFARFIRALNSGTAEDDIRKAFRCADTSRNNLVTLEEFAKWCLQVRVDTVQQAAKAVHAEDVMKGLGADDYVGLALGTLYAGQVAMYDLKSGKQLKVLGILPELQRFELEHRSTEEERDKASHLGKINCIAVDWEGKQFLTGSADHTVKLWNLAGTVERTYHGCISEVLCIAANWERGMFVTGGLASQIKIWDLNESRPLETFQNDRGGDLLYNLSNGTKSVAVGWNQNLVLCAADQWLQLWDLESRTKVENGVVLKPKCIKKLEGHEATVNGVMADFSRMQAVSASSDKTLRLWDLTEGTVLQIWSGHEGEVLCLAGDLQVHVVVSGGSQGDIKFWDTETGECKQTLSRSACMTGTQTAETQVELGGHLGAVTSIALGPRFRFVVSTSCDGTVKMWDRHSMLCIKSIRADEDRYGGVFATDIAVQPKATPI